MPSLVTERIESVKAGVTGAAAFAVAELVLCQLINDELLEYNLDKVRSPKIDAQEIYC